MGEVIHEMWFGEGTSQDFCDERYKRVVQKLRTRFGDQKNTSLAFLSDCATRVQRGTGKPGVRLYMTCAVRLTSEKKIVLEQVGRDFPEIGLYQKFTEEVWDIVREATR